MEGRLFEFCRDTLGMTPSRAASVVIWRDSLLFGIMVGCIIFVLLSGGK